MQEAGAGQFIFHFPFIIFHLPLVFSLRTKLAYEK